MKMSKNPVIAFNQGRALGRQEAWDDIFIAYMYVVLPAMYNAKNDKRMSDKTFAKYAQDTQDEIQRIVTEYFDGDPNNILLATKQYNTNETIEDKAMYFVGEVNKLREKLGMDRL